MSVRPPQYEAGRARCRPVLLTALPEAPPVEASSAPAAASLSDGHVLADPDQVEAVYAALKLLFAAVYNPKYHLKHLLQAGEAFVFDNARVLHARDHFNGNRHVTLMHVATDEFDSRWRQLRSQLCGDTNLI